MQNYIFMNQKTNQNSNHYKSNELFSISKVNKELDITQNHDRQTSKYLNYKHAQWIVYAKTKILKQIVNYNKQVLFAWW